MYLFQELLLRRSLKEWLINREENSEDMVRLDGN